MPRRPFLILQTDRLNPPGYFGDWLARQGRASMAVLLRTDADLPDAGLRARAAAVLVLGDAPISRRADTCPGLADWLAVAHADGMPLLALGDGARRLALALGGTVDPIAPAVRGFHALGLTPAAAHPPWLQAFAPPLPPLLLWHDVGLRAPPGADPLLSGAHGNCQAYARANALGMRAHLHVQPWMCRAWLAADTAAGAPLSATVQSLTEVHDHAARGLGAHRALAARVFRCWLDRAAA